MWRLEDHTADLLIVVEAPGWAELLEEAVRAYGGCLCGGVVPAPRRRVRVPLQVEGADAVETWVQWWRALHRLWTVDGLLPLAAEVAPESTAESAAGHVTCARARDVERSVVEDVKAVTWHEASAATPAGAPAGSRWRGTVVLDV